MPRSISGVAHAYRVKFHPQLRRSGLNCAQLPAPGSCAHTLRIAARVTLGAICLSNSTNFPLVVYSNKRTPVALPPGRAKLSTKPPLTGSMTLTNTTGMVGLVCCTAASSYEATRQHHVRRERGQFRRVFARLIGTAGTPSIVDPQVATPRTDAIIRPECPKCGMRTLLSRISPDGPGYERRTFECPNCKHSVSTIAKF